MAGTLGIEPRTSKLTALRSPAELSAIWVRQHDYNLPKQKEHPPYWRTVKILTNTRVLSH